RAADRDLNADGRLVAARPCSLPAAAGRGAAERELLDPLGNNPAAGRRSPDPRVIGPNAALKGVRPNSWPHPDDLLERAWDHCDHAAVRPQPRHRGSRDGYVGRDQRRERGAAGAAPRYTPDY